MIYERNVVDSFLTYHLTNRVCYLDRTVYCYADTVIITATW